MDHLDLVIYRFPSTVSWLDETEIEVQTIKAQMPFASGMFAFCQVSLTVLAAFQL